MTDLIQSLRDEHEKSKGGENSIEQVNLMKAADQIESEVRGTEIVHDPNAPIEVSELKIEKHTAIIPPGGEIKGIVGSDPGVSASSENYEMLINKITRLFNNLWEISNSIKNAKEKTKSLQLNYKEIEGYVIDAYESLDVDSPIEANGFRVYWNKGKTVVEWDSNVLAIAEKLHSIDTLPEDTIKGIDQMVFSKILKLDKKKLNTLIDGGILKPEDFEGVRTVKPPERRIEVKEL